MSVQTWGAGWKSYPPLDGPGAWSYAGRWEEGATYTSTSPVSVVQHRGSLWIARVGALSPLLGTEVPSEVSTAWQALLPAGPYLHWAPVADSPLVAGTLLTTTVPAGALLHLTSELWGNNASNGLTGTLTLSATMSTPSRSGFIRAMGTAVTTLQPTDRAAASAYTIAQLTLSTGGRSSARTWSTIVNTSAADATLTITHNGSTNWTWLRGTEITGTLSS